MLGSLTVSEWVAVLGLVAGLLAYLFKVERNTSRTATSVEYMSAMFANSHVDNEKDHEVIHRRIDTTNGKVDSHGEKLTKHEIHLSTLLNRGS